MKKRIIAALSVLTAFLLAATGMFTASAASEKNDNKYKVVFVLDSTDSMRSMTDKEKLRYEATQLFLNLMPNEGSMVGSVIFSGGILKENPLVYINSREDREKAEKDLETPEKRGATTVGAALDRAVDMLIDEPNTSLKPYIILLTDGQDKTDADKEKRDDAVAKAKQNGIPVYTIALNSGSKDEEGANVDVLQQIAKSTGGKFQEVTSSNNLTKTLEDYFGSINKIESIPLPEIVVPPDGKIEYSFDIPNHGVEGVNILIYSEKKLRDMSLTKPDGTKIEGSEMLPLIHDAKTFSIVKINRPEGGKWLLNATGDPGTEIEAKMVFNDTVTIKPEYPVKERYDLGEQVTIKCVVYDGDSRLSEDLEKFEVKLFSETIDPGETVMEPASDCFETTVTLDKEGTYRYHIELKGDGLDKATDHFDLNVANDPPEVNDDFEFNKTFTVWPFFTNSVEFDLDGAANDPDGDALSYEVSSSTYKDSTYEIDGTKFIVNDLYDMSNSVTTIRVYDTHKAFAEFDVKIKLVNIGVITLIVIGISAILVLGAFGVVWYILANKRFMGNCFVSTFNYETGEYSEEVMRSKNRGKIPLTAFGLNIPGFNASKCYIQASGKNYVTFCSPKNVYGGGGCSKKIKVTGNETQITATEGASSGIIVRFESRLAGGNGGW